MTPRPASGGALLYLRWMWTAAPKPVTPMQRCQTTALKPPTPLRLAKRSFSAFYRMQRCRRFHRPIMTGEQRCPRFHNDPSARTPARNCTRKPANTSLDSPAHTPKRVCVRYRELPLAISGSRATNTPRQTPNPPKRRPIQPNSLFSAFLPMCLHFGGHITANCGRAATKRGGIALHGGPTRQRHAARRLRVVQNPPLPRSKQAAGLAHTTKLDRKQQSG